MKVLCLLHPASTQTTDTAELQRCWQGYHAPQETALSLDAKLQPPPPVADQPAPIPASCSSDHCAADSAAESIGVYSTTAGVAGVVRQSAYDVQ